MRTASGSARPRRRTAAAGEKRTIARAECTAVTSDLTAASLTSRMTSTCVLLSLTTELSFQLQNEEKTELIINELLRAHAAYEK